MHFKRPSKERKKDYLEISENDSGLSKKKYQYFFTYIYISVHYLSVNRTANFYSGVDESVRSGNQSNSF